MSYTHQKIPYLADCLQWDGSNTDEVMTRLTDENTYAVKYGDTQLIVRFSRPGPGQKSIETLEHGWWVATGMNGHTKCYSDEQFKVKYGALR